MPDVPELKTRKPTGKPPWPMVLLAGVEKSGKSYAGAAFSASELIDRTFWVEIGEGAADQYGALPGARYEIVEHDGSYLGIGRALRAATLQPRPDGKTHAIVLDSVTELWDLLAEEAQAAANERAKRNGKAVPPEGVQITMDLWNAAKKRWRHVVDLLRTYDGPVILTARLEQVTIMDAKGSPTTAKDWKVRAEKNLPFECDVVVKMPVPGTAILTGARSLRLRTGTGLEVDDFSLEKLMLSLGLDAASTSARTYVAPRAEQAAPAPEPPPAGQLQRSRGQQPADEWSTPADAAPPAAPETVALAWTEEDREQLLADTFADMAAAITPEELGAVAARVVEAYTAGKIRLKDKDLLEKDYARLMHALRGAAVNA